ncbi:MAG: hypothetical protein HKN70_04130 [Gammaproteobacteria bacterium]|nr:hypothetical protein [Gammaproteobacteria bacterium]
MVDSYAGAWRSLKILMIAGCVALAMSAKADIAPYSQDFEGMDPDDPSALSSDFWGVFGAVYDGTTGAFLYNYGGVFPAPNDGTGFSGVAVGEGGPDQGANQLVIYNDYNNTGEHDAGNLVEATVFRQLVIGAADVGKTWVFTFDAKRGNIVAPSIADAFIRTIDDFNNATNNLTLDTSDLPATWGRYSLFLEIIPELVGQRFQFGFSTTTTNYVPSGNFYDNITLAEDVDSDGDGVGNTTDNCTDLANPGQEDTDGDLIGNRCDADFDNNCVVNFGDISLFPAEYLGTNPLFDHNASGAVNFGDYAILTSYYLQPPGPSAAGCN